jgi:hypothetical protein
MKQSVKDFPVHHVHHKMLPVWFFVGILLLVYGIIILYVGIREFSHPAPVVLASYHASIWSGPILILLGGFYMLRYWPRRYR